MAEEALARARERREIEPIEQAREAVAATQHERDVGLRVGGDARDRREPLVVGRREPLEAPPRAGVAADTVTEAFEARDRAIDGQGIRREARRREDRERKRRHAAAPRRRAAKNCDSSAP